MKTILKKLIKAYAYCVSPLLGKNCRFHPTCSAYMEQAIDKHGVAKGLFLGGRRLCKCHPFYKGKFYDPVP